MASPAIKRAPKRQIAPQEGAQARFLSSSADIVIGGGGAGGGKSFALLLDPLRDVWNPGFRAVCFRKTTPELTAPGGLWDKAQGLYPYAKGRARDRPLLEWRFPSGAWIRFTHCEHDKDVRAHQGAEYAAVLFDELTHFSSDVFWFIVGRMRTVCGVRPRLRATCNPDPDSFVRELIDWWIGEDGFPIPERDGVLRYFARDSEKMIWGDTPEEVYEQAPHLFEEGEPLNNVVMSITFVRMTLADNPAMVEADPQYRAKLASLPLVQRRRLRDGNWDAREAAGTMFRGEWYEIVDKAPTNVRWRIRYWDFAGSKRRRSDFTAGALMSITDDGTVYVEDMRNEQMRPKGVEDLVRLNAELDGKDIAIFIEQEEGAAGAIVVDAFLRRVVPGWSVEGVKVRGEGTKIVRARPASAWVEAGHVKLVRAPWNREFISQCEAFPGPGHDDMVDAFAGGFNKLHEGGELAYASA